MRDDLAATAHAVGGDGKGNSKKRKHLEVSKGMPCLLLLLLLVYW
jgi:hypothetical protein